MNFNIHKKIPFIFRKRKSTVEYRIYGEHCKKMPTFSFYAPIRFQKLHKLNGINQNECNMIQQKAQCLLSSSFFFFIIERLLHVCMKMTELPNK